MVTVVHILRFVINNYYGDNNRVIINNSTFVSDDHSKNTVIYAPDNSDNSVSFSNSTTNNNNDKDKDSKDGKDSSSSSSESKRCFIKFDKWIIIFCIKLNSKQ